MHDPIAIIEGRRIDDIPSLYRELNRVFMIGESWEIGQSLDALNDLLYGSYGVLQGAAKPTVVWKNSEHSRKALGRETTKDYYLSKLSRPDIFNAQRIQQSLDELENGGGQTYFDIVLEIFSDHPEISLFLEP